MFFDHCYQSELTVLRQLGCHFAEHSPALAPLLGRVGCDPGIERLLEGFAFLTGRLRQKLDDESPELSHSMMHLLWLSYTRPLSASSILRFGPLAHSGGVLCAGCDTLAESRPVSEVACHFRVCYATEILPLVLEALNYSVIDEGTLLGLRLAMNCDGHLSELGLSRLRLHLAGEHYISQIFYLCLLRSLESIQLIPLDTHGRPLDGVAGKPMSFRLTGGWVQPAGFVEDEALIPHPLNTSRGYCHLQEYLAFQDKSLFIDVDGLDLLGALPEEAPRRIRGLELRFDIRKSGTQHLHLMLESIKLYCTPVVNLFRHNVLPIRLDGKQDECLLMPVEYSLEDYGVLSIKGVAGWQPGGSDYQVYIPLESLEHDPGLDVPETRSHYGVRQRTSSLHDGLDTYLSFGTHHPEQIETLPVKLTYTNQNLSQRLRLGDICVACGGMSEFLSFRNVTPATSNYAPPLNRDFLWKPINNMSPNCLSLANVDALEVILGTYDLPCYYDQHAAKVSERLLGRLEVIRHEHVDRLCRGPPLHGLHTELTINLEDCISKGDLFVLASILNEFFALYVSISSCHELWVRNTQGDVYQWELRMGLRSLL